MKLINFTTCCLLIFLSVNIFAQVRQNNQTTYSTSSKSIQLKLFGSSNLIGVAYEYRPSFENGLLGLQAGFGYGFQKTLSSGGNFHFLGISASKNGYGNQLPDLNMLGLTTGCNALLGKRKNHFEIGLYITNYYTDVKTLSNLSSNLSHWGSYKSMDLGYRYANPEKRLSFATGISFITLGPGKEIFKRWETMSIYPYFSLGFAL